MSAEPTSEFVKQTHEIFEDSRHAPSWMREQIETIKKSAQKQREAMADPSKLFLPHQSRARRRLTPLYMYRYIRDSIRLRRYNDSIHQG